MAAPLFVFFMRNRISFSVSLIPPPLSSYLFIYFWWSYVVSLVLELRENGSQESGILA